MKDKLEVMLGCEFSCAEVWFLDSVLELLCDWLFLVVFVCVFDCVCFFFFYCYVCLC